MAVTNDLPINFQNEATLLDANAGFFLQDANLPNSKIFVEKYVTKKQDYQFLPIGTQSEFHQNAFLFAEEDFTDIGGGLMTFNRKYATIPESVSQMQSASVSTGRIIGFEGITGGSANFIGGDLENGSQYIQDDFVIIQNKSTQTVFAEVLRTFVQYDELTFDQTSEIMNIKKFESVTRAITYERVSMTREPVYLNGGAGVVYTSFKLTPTRTTVNSTVISNRASIFDKGTVFRRELVGRYLGNIYEVREYALFEDTVLKYGNLQNGDTLNINLVS